MGPPDTSTLPPAAWPEGRESRSRVGRPSPEFQVATGSRVGINREKVGLTAISAIPLLDKKPYATATFTAARVLLREI